MAGRLNGKVALISGGARGMGAAEGKLFAREGAKVVLGDILDEEGQHTAKDIAAAGESATYVHLDVTKPADWQKAVDTTVSTYGKLNVLVNNAGILRMPGLEETTMELWDQIIAINQTGTFLGMKYAVPAMRKAGGGSIINLSSMAGVVGLGVATAYQATKGAIRVMTKTVAIQYAKENIRVNSLHPGVIATRMVTDLLDVEARKGFEQAIPVGREGTAEEVAAGALFLASDDSVYMTGAELAIDGGYTAQ